VKWGLGLGSLGGELSRRSGALGDPIGYRFTGDAIFIKIGWCGVNKARNDDAAEIEHEAVGDGHDRHVGRVSPGGDEEADGLIGPRFTGEFEEVFEGRVDVVVVDGRGDHDRTGLADEHGGFGDVGVAISGSAIAERQGKIPEIEDLVRDTVGREGGARGFDEKTAFASRIEAGGND